MAAGSPRWHTAESESCLSVGYTIYNLLTRCGTAGDDPERRLWRMKRRMRSGSNTAIAEQTTACESRADVTTGSALALGACPGRNTVENEKARKPFVYAEFRYFKEMQNCVDFEFDHSLSHFHAKTKKLNRYPGVAQLGARVVWDHQAAGSIPVTRTKTAVLTAKQGRKEKLCGLFS